MKSRRYSLPPPVDRGEWPAPYRLAEDAPRPRWTLIAEVWSKDPFGDACLGAARFPARDLLEELAKLPKPPHSASTAPTASPPAVVELPLRPRLGAKKKERKRAGGAVTLHFWPPPAWAVAKEEDELEADAYPRPRRNISSLRKSLCGHRRLHGI